MPKGKGKRSFFERLTGTVSIDDYDDVFEEENGDPYAANPQHQASPRPQASSRPSPQINRTPPPPPREPQHEPHEIQNDWAHQEEPEDGQLSVDVYQTSDEIVIRAHVAGVRPDDLDITITRDMVTIKGRREEAKEVDDDGYFYKELYWGSFSRTILLPQEIEVEEAKATEKHGLLVLRLPKIDKERQTRLKVKAG